MVAAVVLDAGLVEDMVAVEKTIKRVLVVGTELGGELEGEGVEDSGTVVVILVVDVTSMVVICDDMVCEGGAEVVDAMAGGLAVSINSPPPVPANDEYAATVVVEATPGGLDVSIKIPPPTAADVAELAALMPSPSPCVVVVVTPPSPPTVVTTTFGHSVLIPCPAKNAAISRWLFCESLAQAA